MNLAIDRRSLLLALAGAGALTSSRATLAQPLRLAPAAPFSFAGLIAAARRAASEPYRPPVQPNPDVLDRLTYDEHWQIKFRDALAQPVSGMPLHLFHLSKYAREPIAVHLLEGGTARRVIYRRSLFEMPQDSPARELDDGAGFAGFRLMRPGGGPDWISFLGASYFRCDGPDAQYGLSARGLALDTGLAAAEEFPRFTAFWIGPGERQGEDASVYARLDSPSLTGAYRIGAKRDVEGDQHTEIEARLFLRTSVQRLGVAPLTSMFWYSEANRTAGGDWRPEVHDSDGLALHTGAGERIWRPLRNPTAVTTTSFVDDAVRGFGLAQRDRDFSNYQDDGVFYHRRPTAWIVPQNAWGPGAVQLVEIPTDDETFDNIVAYWTPRTQPSAGAALSFDYRIEWRRRDPAPDPVGWTFSTRRGAGGIPGQPLPEGVAKYVIDFLGGALQDAEEGVELSLQTSGGSVLRPSVRPVIGTRRWRAIFDLAAPPGAPIDVRAYLHRGGLPLTETWTLLTEQRPA